jgi:pimeloyl-ACP methyl ester carboxylesterase
MTHPYERGKIPVVLIHGLGSSPLAWAEAVNDLRGDPVLRSRYQIWIYMYLTRNPFLLSAADLRRSIEELRSVVDPGADDPAFDQMVIVGHSMGGLIAKLAVTESGDKLWRLLSLFPFEQLKGAPEHRSLVAQMMFFRPVFSIRRVVFLATPHRGSRLGKELFGRIGDHLIRLRSPLRDVHERLVAHNGAEFFTARYRDDLPSSNDELEWQNPLLLAMNELPIAPGVRCHTIVGRVGFGALEDSSDGVVPYASAHLDWAASELVVPTSHSCQDNPRIIGEIRRILYEHVGFQWPAEARPQ